MIQKVRRLKAKRVNSTEGTEGFDGGLTDISNCTNAALHLQSNLVQMLGKSSDS